MFARKSERVQCSVIMVTARGEDFERMGLEKADDYIVSLFWWRSNENKGDRRCL